MKKVLSAILMMLITLELSPVLYAARGNKRDREEMESSSTLCTETESETESETETETEPEPEPESVVSNEGLTKEPPTKRQETISKVIVMKDVDTDTEVKAFENVENAVKWLIENKCYFKSCNKSITRNIVLAARAGSSQKNTRYGWRWEYKGKSESDETRIKELLEAVVPEEIILKAQEKLRRPLENRNEVIVMKDVDTDTEVKAFENVENAVKWLIENKCYFKSCNKSITKNIVLAARAGSSQKNTRYGWRWEYKGKSESDETRIKELLEAVVPEEIILKAQEELKGPLKNRKKVIVMKNINTNKKIKVFESYDHAKKWLQETRKLRNISTTNFANKKRRYGYDWETVDYVPREHDDLMEHKVSSQYEKRYEPINDDQVLVMCSIDGENPEKAFTQYKFAVQYLKFFGEHPKAVRSAFAMTWKSEYIRYGHKWKIKNKTELSNLDSLLYKAESK